MTRSRSISHLAPQALFAGAMALGAAACGGEDRGRPQPVQTEVEPVDYCELERSYEFLPITDFEPLEGATLNRESARCEDAFRTAPGPASPDPVPMRSCTFNFNYDTANSPRPSATGCPLPVVPGASVETNFAANMAQLAGQQLPEPRCGEDLESGLRLTAKNMAMCYNPDTGRLGWGGSMQLETSRPNQNVMIETAIDASAWEGIAFWVRKASAETQSSLMFTVADEVTMGDTPDPETMMSCSVLETAPDSLKCDAFGVTVTLRDEWTFIPVKFASMRQKGFGLPSSRGALDPSRLRRIQVLLTAGNWDFWIDDISLFRSATAN